VGSFMNNGNMIKSERNERLLNKETRIRHRPSQGRAGKMVGRAYKGKDAQSTPVS